MITGLDFGFVDDVDLNKSFGVFIFFGDFNFKLMGFSLWNVFVFVRVLFSFSFGRLGFFSGFVVKLSFFRLVREFEVRDFCGLVFCLVFRGFGSVVVDRG